MNICLIFENSVINTLFNICSIISKSKSHVDNLKIFQTEK